VLGNVNITVGNGLQESRLGSSATYLATSSWRTFPDPFSPKRPYLNVLAIMTACTLHGSPLPVVERDLGSLNQESTVERKGVLVNLDITTLLVRDQVSALSPSVIFPLVWSPYGDTRSTSPHLRTHHPSTTQPHPLPFTRPHHTAKPNSTHGRPVGSHVKLGHGSMGIGQVLLGSISAQASHGCSLPGGRGSRGRFRGSRFFSSLVCETLGL
jgi:hypothetical protein